MSTAFQTGFGNGDIIKPEHVKQFSGPVNDLESGAALYREAIDDGGLYQVDFQPSANPDAHFIEELTPGQVIVFKASHPSPADAQLKVLVDGGFETYPLFMGGTQVGIDEILTDQVVIAVFNDTTVPRFDVVGGGGGFVSLSELSDVEVSTPSLGEVLRYDGDEFVNATLEIDDVDGLSAALISAGGTLGGNLADLQGLSLVEGDIFTVNSTGELIKLSAGDEGDVLKIVSGVPAWGEPVGGGGGGGDFLVTGLVAHGARYSEITSTSDNLTSSTFTPVLGRQYLIRWIANHTTSVAQLNLANAVTNGQAHFCRAVETGDSTIHDIGFSGPTAADYACEAAQRTRTHEFVWTATTDKQVRIVLGQPSLDYGEFTGTLLVYEVRDGAINLGWGSYSSGYSWLANSANSTNSLSGGSYMPNVSLDANKTYAFIGNWCQGCSMKMVLREGTTYYRLPANDDTWVLANASDNAWDGGFYYEYSYIQERGEFIRMFSPPHTGVFELGCGFWSISSGCFWLLEIP